MILRRHSTNFKRELTNYFRLTALDDNVTFTVSKGNNVKTTYLTYLEYSIDEGKTWTRMVNTNSTITITISNIRLGDSVLFRGSGNTLSSSGSTATGYFTRFKSNKKFKVSGVLMTLLKGKWADENTPMGTSLYTFKQLFTDLSNLIDASDLIFPPNVTNYCYSWMFYKCTNLTKGPTLPALILANNCYLYMFFNCTKLTYIRMLATNISASACLSNWFPATQTNLEFHRNPEATWWVTGTSGLPAGCTLFDDTETLAEEESFIDTEVLRIALSVFGNKIPQYRADRWKGNVRIGGINGKLLKRQLANVLAIWTEFSGNLSIIDMSDFTKFTGLTRIGTSGIVGKNGFYNCVNLQVINLPPTVTCLGLGYSYAQGCFTNCRSLQRLYMPDSVTTFNSSCFYNCTSLTYVRYSSNCPFPTFSTASNNGFFYNCSNLEEIENFPTETTTWITADAFRGCSKLDFSSVLDFNKLVRIGGYGLNGGTNWPSEIVFSSLTDISGNFALNFGNNCAVDKIYLPKLTNTGGRYSLESLARLIDLGNVTGGLFYTYHYANTINSNASDVTVIMRSKAVPSLTSLRNTYLKRLYVYPSIIDDFKTTYTTLASKTLPIGGEEWATEFGSYYEYADYPLSDPFTFNESTDSSMFIEYPMYNPLVSLTLRFNDSNYRSIVIPISKVKWGYTRMGGTEFREITGVTATVDGEGNLSGFTVLTAAVSGDLTPNKPYIVTTGMNGDGNGLYPEIIHSNGVVEATTPITDEFTSNGYKFSFTGTYETITDMEGKYTFNGTNWVLCTSSDTMKPTYVYMEVTKIEQE